MKSYRRRLSSSRASAILAMVFTLVASVHDASADQILLVAGGGNAEPPGTATEVQLKEPFGTEFDAAGNAWIIEMVSGNRLLKRSVDGILSHMAGRLQSGYSGDGGPVLQAQFNGPHNIAVLSESKVLVADTWNGVIREVNVATGLVRTISGYGVAMDKAKGNGPYCIALDDSKSRLFIADLRQILVLDLKTNSLKVFAGNGKKGVPTDGSIATDAPLQDPRAVAVDHLGNVYILERGGNALRVVDGEGKIRTVVNTSGKVGSSGDGGPAVDALLNGPKHLCVDRDNSVIIADAENNLVRRYVPSSGKLERVAGTGQKGGAGLGGVPQSCQLARPHGVSIHPTSGELYITDSYNNRVLRIKRD